MESANGGIAAPLEQLDEVLSGDESPKEASMAMRFSNARACPGTIRNILVAVDDSEPAQWALDEAVTLAEALEARVSLVHVIEVAPVLTPEFAFTDAIRRPALVHAARQLLHRLEDRIPAELGRDQILREGDADKQIVAAAQQIRADLIVIGRHGRGLLGRLLLGSVAEAVVRHATCPVLTVGHPRQCAASEPSLTEMAHAEAEVG